MSDDNAVSITKFLESDYGIKVRGLSDTPGKIRVTVPPSPDQKALVDAGKATVETLQPHEEELDIAKVEADLRNSYQVPPEIPTVLNKANHAIDDSPLGFVDRVKYEVARKAPDKARFLKDRFGAENISFDPEAQRLKVRKDGVWYDADSTGIEGFVGAEGDVIAGYMAGAAAASKAVLPAVAGVAAASGGTLAAPAALVGGLAVTAAGTISALVTRYGTMKAAEQAGLRTEQDAEETLAELGKEGIFILAGDATLPVLKHSGKALWRSLNGAVGKIASKTTSEAATRDAAHLMSAQLGLDYVDSYTWLSDLDKTMKYQRMGIEWEQAGGRGTNPVRAEAATNLQQATDRLMEDTYTAFRKEQSKLRPTLEKAEVDLSPVKEEVDAIFADLNSLIPKYGDAPSKRQLGTVQEIFDKALNIKRSSDSTAKITKWNVDHANKISSVYPDRDLLANAEAVSKMSIQEIKDKTMATSSQAARELKDEAGKIVENLKTQDQVATQQAMTGSGTKGYSVKPLAQDIELDPLTLTPRNTTRTTVNALESRDLINAVDDLLQVAGHYSKLDREISSRAAQRALQLRGILEKQELQAISKIDPVSAMRYDYMNKTFSSRRSFLDEMAKTSQDEKVDVALDFIMGKRGGFAQKELAAALDSVGMKGDEFIKDLYARRAAWNSLPVYRTKSTGAIVPGLLRWNSPERTAKIAAKKFNQIQGIAKANNFVMQLPKKERDALLQSPDMMKALRQITVQAIQGANDGTDALVQQGLQETMPNPTPLQPIEEKAK
jgi:hypothetical protein